MRAGISAGVIIWFAGSKSEGSKSGGSESESESSSIRAWRDIVMV